MAAPTFRDRAAIAGVGYTPFSRDSGVSTLTLAIDTILAALGDAGLDIDDVDGLATHRVGDSAPPWVVAPALGGTTSPRRCPSCAARRATGRCPAPRSPCPPRSPATSSRAPPP